MKKFLFIALFGALLLITILCGLCAWLFFSGRTEWKETKAALLAKGELLTLAELAPPDIPAENNFFAHPMWEKLADPENNDDNRWLKGLTSTPTDTEREDLSRLFPEFSPISPDTTYFELARNVLQATENSEELPSKKQASFVLACLASSAPTLTEIATLAERSRAKFPHRYSEGFPTAFAHASKLLKAAQILSMRTKAHLALGDNTAALADLFLLLKLAELMKSEPLLISMLVRISIIQIALNLIHAGIPSWNESELLQLQKKISDIHLGAQLLLSLRAERAGANMAFERMLANPSNIIEILNSTSETPSSRRFLYSAGSQMYATFLLDSDRSFFNREIQLHIETISADLPLMRPASHQALQNRILSDLDTVMNSLCHVISHITIPALSGAVIRVAFTQNQVHQALISCAIQRYFLAHRQLPQSLDELTPDYLQAVPVDIITGKPMSFRATGATTYVLWSVGWNETDEGGTRPKMLRRFEENDWVWEGSTIPESNIIE